ncbi:hypothetical protein RD792_006322 [Penstemon davidsonii]|uniref:Protein kinase domain-containing protein n=1 Tax=Penstemon davidsonii TaxID=160366 RepID=A0ABR0DCV5_9LAMI|nr:hypothetical protein RD792_006322 [Penstemon davidsonii]
MKYRASFLKIYAANLQSSNAWVYIYGEIPSGLTRCRMLQNLSLSFNQLTGNIPSEIGNLSSLQYAAFSRNHFSGTIPSSIGNMSSLTILDLSDNNLRGEIPTEMGLLSNLTYLNLEMNELNGEMSQSIFNLSRLRVLSLVGNELSGTIPFSVNRGLPNLERLFLGINRFTGRIPNSISNLTNLKILDLANNSFSGHIPITLGNLHNIESLNLQANQFTNDLSTPEQDFITPLTRCRYLTYILFSVNPITGLLPKSIDNLSTSLENFRSFSCKISGIIPDEIGNMSSLISLALAKNELMGMIPPTIGQLRNLQRFGIEDNKLWGSIPYSFCNLENLYYASLEGNAFSGQLPRCMGNLVSLRELYMAKNAFSFNIPSTLWSFERILAINLSHNFFDGSIPLDIGNLESVVVLDLSGNQFSGEIPIAVGQLQSINALVLSNNKLHGRIPESFDNLKSLQYLDLSHNNLSGEIPKSLEKLSDLVYFNVSFNELRGEIPDGGSFRNFTGDFFRSNNGLCGASRFNVEVCKMNNRKSSSKSRLLRYILPPVAAIAFAATISIMYLRYCSRKSSLLPKSNSHFDIIRHRMSYYELLRATNNLAEANLVGRGSIGSVYKGILDNGMIVVKVFNLDMQGALKSFDTECQILSSIRHRNLVKVITSCANLDFKALVLEYMPNGNLDKWLYSPDNFLNFTQRLRIMIDVAFAIEYLHEGYSSPIIHCDLKPSNILLDEDMVAHVGDFGISKLLTQDQRIAQTKTLGTIGYMAPEYGSAGLVSTSVDVYSYGILLMETFTRHKPTNEMFLGELTLRSWVFESLPNGLMEIVDVDLLNEDEENFGAKNEMFLKSIIELALECTNDSPEERLNIKDALLRLKKINNELEEMKPKNNLL